MFYVILDADEDAVYVDIEDVDFHLSVIVRVRFEGRTLHLLDLHVQGDGANSLGPVVLRRLIHEIMEDLDVDTIVVGGARRTSGAGPGRVPRPLRFARKVPSRN